MIGTLANNFAFLGGGGSILFRQKNSKKAVSMSQQLFVYFSDWKIGTYESWCTYVEVTLANMSGKDLLSADTREHNKVEFIREEISFSCCTIEYMCVLFRKVGTSQ